MTTLLYLEQNNLLESEAKILEIFTEGDIVSIILDKTILYPQGGGQPYDTGKIYNKKGEFAVSQVRFIEGKVLHKGNFRKGVLDIGDDVMVSVNPERRILLSRIHSAGHLVDKAIKELGLSWKPGKGYHYPEGAYVEYEGLLGMDDREKLKIEIETLCNKYTSLDSKTQILFMTKEEMLETCHYAPDFPQEKDCRARIVVHDGYYMPCGGTPVDNLSQIGTMTIRKIKQEGPNIRVAYAIS